MYDLTTCLKKVQALCEFSCKSDPTGIDLEHIFQLMDETKSDTIWENSIVKQYQGAVRSALHIVATNIYKPGYEFEIEPPTAKHIINNDGEKLRLITRFTSGLNDQAKISIRIRVPSSSKNKSPVKGKMPFLVYRAIELLTYLPLNTLRPCKANDCKNTFATFHRTKAYCSPRCRNRTGVYAARRKQKGSK